MMIRSLLTILAAAALCWIPGQAFADQPTGLETFTPEPVIVAEDEAAPAADEAAPAVETAAEEEDMSAPLTKQDRVEMEFLIHNLWIAIAAFLVFIMHLGFASLESGLTQAKNTTNILFKNTFIIAIGLITYFAIGFNLMYPADWTIGGVLGNFGPSAWGIPGWTDDPSVAGPGYNASYPVWTDFLFQGMFAATAATIISGCVAERIKLLPFLIFAAIYVAFLYPAVGSWHWGGGWLAERGFYDFAGSTLVHSVGGWGGLAAILVLGPRKGKYVDGKIRPILPSNLPLAAIGVFLLWFGWFGFNGGSVLSASAADLGYVVTTTSLAAAVGGITAGVCSWIFGKKPDLTMALNGILAGLVGITAAPDTSFTLTFVVGIICGIAVYFAVLMFDKLKIDDPVGALSVHLVCGIIGTFFAGLGYNGSGVGIQIIGILAYGITSFVFALVLALVIKAIFGFRVSAEEEEEGLDMGEHGVSAYNHISAT